MSEPNSHFAKASELHCSLHEVVLPGTSKPVLLRDLPVSEFAAEGALPMSLAAKITGSDSAPAITEEDLRAYAEWVKRAVSLVIVLPQCAPLEQWGKVSPEDDLLDPTLLPAEAQRFLIDFAKGEIDASSNRVDRFRGTSGAAPVGGSHSEDAEVPPKRVAEGQRG
jgi:hypothetical protein